MTNGNKTLNSQYRFLSEQDFPELYKANVEAFSDYVVPLQVSFEQFENHFIQNAIDINLSVGAFNRGKLVGYTLNGFGIWNGVKTAYDGGTGVIPKYRRQGIGKALFDFLLPKLREIEIKQMLLEVISNNEKAIELYRQIGFEETRKLLFFEQTKDINLPLQNTFNIRQLENLEWKNVQNFWDKPTSWQFSVEAIKRKTTQNLFFGAFLDKECIGYGVLFPSSGIIPQMAVDKKHRRKKVGTMLLAEMQKYVQDDKQLRFSNVDRDLHSLIRFAGKLDFTPTISQFEMLLKL